MNTITSLPRTALLALALGVAGATASFADTTTTTPPSTTAPPAEGGWKHHFDKILTPAEQTELKNAHDAVMATNPTLKTEEATLKQQRESLGENATPEQKQAFFTQMHDFRQQMQAAELKVDPNLAPIFAKLAAAHKDWHQHQQSGSNT